MSAPVIPEINVDDFIMHPEAYTIRDGRKVTVMYQVCDSELCNYVVADGLVFVVTPVPRGTIHIGEFTNFMWEDIEAGIVSDIGFRIYYELRPGETIFKKVFDLKMKFRTVVPYEGEAYGIRMFDIGAVGNVTKTRSPEDVARSYFPNGDFSFFFTQDNLQIFARDNVLNHVSRLSQQRRKFHELPPNRAPRVPALAYANEMSQLDKIKSTIKDDRDEFPVIVLGAGSAAALTYIGSFNPFSPWIILPGTAYYIRFLARKKREQQKIRDAQRLTSDRRLKNSAVTGTLVHRLISPGISKPDTSKHADAIVKRVFSRQPDRGGKTKHHKRNKSLKSNTRKYKHK